MFRYTKLLKIAEKKHCLLIMTLRYRRNVDVFTNFFKILTCLYVMFNANFFQSNIFPSHFFFGAKFGRKTHLTSENMTRGEKHTSDSFSSKLYSHIKVTCYLVLQFKKLEHFSMCVMCTRPFL